MTISLILLKFAIIIICLYFMISRLVRYFRYEKSQTLFKLLATLTVWGTILILTIFPEISREISEKLGMGQNLNTLIFLGFVVTFIIIFRLLRTIETLESNLTEIVRKDALRNIITTQGEETKDKRSRSDTPRKG